MELINNLQDIETIIKENDLALVYFTTTECNVCKELLPKIEKMLEVFPKIKPVKVHVDEEKSFVGAYSIFTVPTVILFVMGKENVRRGRTFSVVELENSIRRYYEMLVD